MSDTSSSEDSTYDLLNNLLDPLDHASLLDYPDLDPDTLMTLAGFNECFNSLHQEHFISAADGDEPDEPIEENDGSEALEFSETTDDIDEEAAEETPMFQPFTLIVENAKTMPILTPAPPPSLEECDIDPEPETAVSRQRAELRKRIMAIEGLTEELEGLDELDEVEEVEEESSSSAEVIDDLSSHGNFILPALIEEESKQEAEKVGKQEGGAKAEFATDLMFEAFKELDSYFQ